MIFTSFSIVVLNSCKPDLLRARYKIKTALEAHILKESVLKCGKRYNSLSSSYNFEGIFHYDS